MDTVNIHVPSKLIRDFSIFSVSKALRSSASARCTTVANIIYRFMMFLVLRLFRWMICVLILSVLLCF
jgi:hypothetical protein